MNPLLTAPGDAASPARPPPYENRSLFSDAWLAGRVEGLARWGDDASAAWERARALWAPLRGRLAAGAGAAETAEAWVLPVLREVLGWSADAPPGAGGPDLVLFVDDDERRAAAEVTGDERRYYERAAAVAAVAPWGHPLDARGDDPGGRNPSFGVAARLAAAGVDWGILTDGRRWRLVSARARSRLDAWFAVDLARALEADDAEAFRWFWLFFRAASHRPDPPAEESFLDTVLRGSADEAAALEGELRRVVVEDVFERLARGFVDGRRRRGVADGSGEDLATVFDATLRLLYRLFFVLHAEARGLLPADDAEGYARHALARIRRAVAARVDAGERLSGASTGLWDELSALFDLVARGDDALRVPRCDGALFRDDDECGRFLRENPVADSFLARALDHLSRGAGGRFFDFRPLRVEQLGSLYEALLELRLEGGEQGKPVLVNAHGERKATGSYYTPHWVVEYVVAEALAPAFAARADAFRAALADAAERRARLQGADDVAREVGERESARLAERAADELLNLRVCDPAMGSGHFLVHAADWLTERLAALCDELPGNPVLARVDALRREIADSLAARGAAADPSGLSDARLLKRMVVKRSLYGVDLNPMAVELARLALWLDAFVPGAPLPLLDHHLREGNALVGARVAEVQRAIEEGPQGQLDAFGGPFRELLRRAGSIRAVAARTDATPGDAAAGAEAYAAFEGEMAPYRRLLDVWVSRAFGNRPGEELAGVRGDDVLRAARGERVVFSAAHHDALSRAGALGQEHRFFHWELEFPEAFVEAERAAWRENPGFDAVVGNPPYVRHEQVKALKPYLSATFADVYDGAADLYVYFCRQGMELLRRGGRLSYVLTNKWLRAGYGEGLRDFLARRGRVERVVDFGHAPVFPDADVFPCIVVVRRPSAAAAPAADPEQARVTVVPRGEPGRRPLGRYVDEHAYEVPALRFGRNPWSLERTDIATLLEKIRRAGVPLREYVGAPPLYGIKTGLNEAFLIDHATRDRLVREDPHAAGVMKPYLRGQDVERWAPAWAGLWMVVLQSSENHAWPWSSASGHEAERRFAHAFPSLYAHFKPMEDRLRARTDQGQHWWELRSCAYYPLFEQRKIVYRDLTFHSAFSFDAHGYYANDLCFILPSDDPWLAAVLNSPVMWAYLWRVVAHGKDEVLRLKNLYMEPLPVAPPPGALRGEADAAVGRLVELTEDRRQLEREMFDWLWAEFTISQPGQRLEAFADLAADDFIEEVRRRRPKKAPPLAPRQVAALRQAHGELAPRLRTTAAKAAGLEHRLSALVSRAYGLTTEDLDLMWSTAPPRMPVGR